ncbi:MAG: glycosyltransferase, partial [Gammaproteobacteria bacterium]|nr:glycosyltransferase [Gammaproteobacteria bacterium]
MKLVLFYHSLISDWNHGNAHFLRGIAAELLARGHDVEVYEPRDAWSVGKLLEEQGSAALDAFRRRYPQLESRRYDLDSLDLDAALDGADIVLVHEWNPVALVERIGRHRMRAGQRYRLFFHDTHHRAVSAPDELERYPLDGFDGALVFGEAIAEIYRHKGWGDRVWVWHEAADTRIFRPAEPPLEPEADLVWIGNWGDGERTNELRQFLFDPAASLGLRGSVYGVRYPREALAVLASSGLEYRGWTANFDVPQIFHRHRFTVHVPRSFYTEALPGIPTIRVFEALACGIPLISAPWSDAEGLFAPGRDYLIARTGDEMKEAMRSVVSDPDLAAALAASGLDRIRRRHTCAHRVDELLAI